MTDDEAVRLALAYRTPSGQALPVVYIQEPDVYECVISVDFRDSHSPPVVSREYNRRWHPERMR